MFFSGYSVVSLRRENFPVKPRLKKFAAGFLIFSSLLFSIVPLGSLPQAKYKKLNPGIPKAFVSKNWVKMGKKIKNLAGERVCKKEFWIRVFISILVLEQIKK